MLFMKEKIRREFLDIRNSLKRELRKKKSLEIVEKLLHLSDYKNSSVVCCYVSFGSEVDTHNLIKKIFKEKKVCVPVVQGKDIVFSSIQSFEDVDSKNEYGIMEPSRKKLVDVKNIDFMIVPGIAFDSFGNRIGYGKGYYDRVLKDFSGTSVGLCFKEQLVEKIPVEKWDWKVDIVLSD